MVPERSKGQKGLATALGAVEAMVETLAVHGRLEMRDNTNFLLETRSAVRAVEVVTVDGVVEGDLVVGLGCGDREQVLLVDALHDLEEMIDVLPNSDLTAVGLKVVNHSRGSAENRGAKGALVHQGAMHGRVLVLQIYISMQNIRRK